MVFQIRSNVRSAPYSFEIYSDEKEKSSEDRPNEKALGRFLATRFPFQYISWMIVFVNPTDGEARDETMKTPRL